MRSLKSYCGGSLRCVPLNHIVAGLAVRVVTEIDLKTGPYSTHAAYAAAVPSSW